MTKHFVSIDIENTDAPSFGTREDHENSVPARCWHGIERICEGYGDSEDIVSSWDAADWFGQSSMSDLGITPEMSDEALSARIGELEAEALASGECDELVGASEYLTSRHDRMRRSA